MKTPEYIPFSKELLRQILGYSKSRFNRKLKALHGDLIAAFPRYKSRCKFLSEKMFFWLAEELEMDEETAKSQIIDIIKNNELYRNSISKNFGVSKKNIDLF